jgi:hypothetical protein
MVTRTVRALTVVTVTSTGVDRMESGCSGDSARPGSIIAMVPAAATAFNASLRLTGFLMS